MVYHFVRQKINDIKTWRIKTKPKSTESVAATTKPAALETLFDYNTIEDDFHSVLSTIAYFGQ